MCEKETPKVDVITGIAPQTNMLAQNANERLAAPLGLPVFFGSLLLGSNRLLVVCRDFLVIIGTQDRAIIFHHPRVNHE